MMTPWDARESKLDGHLARWADASEWLGGGTWALTVVNGSARTVTARMTEDWLLLEAPWLSESAAGEWWPLLLANHGLESGVKFALAAKSSVRMQAEVPVEESDESDVEERIGAVIQGFRLASEGGSLPGSPQEPEVPNDQTRRICAEAGWAWKERDVGLVVDLPVPGGFYQAQVTGCGGQLLASVEIAQRGEVAAESRTALGAFLLNSSRVVRYARASMLEDGDGISPLFEVRYRAEPTPFELDRGLSALTVACRMFAREAQALLDPAVARTYLAVRGLDHEKSISR